MSILVPDDIGKHPQKAFELVASLEKVKEEIFDKLFREYFREVFVRGGKCYSPAMEGEAYGIFRVGYSKPLKVKMEVAEVGKYGGEWNIFYGVFWANGESKNFEWISISRKEDAVAYAQQAKKFFTDLGITVL